MEVIKPPTALPNIRVNGIVPSSVFFAGSIEMGKAENWQDPLANMFSNRVGFIFNPRRDNWDSEWEQSINNPNFYEQVTWELTALDIAEAIIMYFDPETTSPISLVELGLYAHTGKMFVCCPEGFYKKGNVDIVCERYNIPMCADIQNLVRKAKAFMKAKTWR